MRLAEYGVAYDLDFFIPKLDDTDLAATGDWTPATGDVKISLNGANFANTTNLPTAIGGTGSVGWNLVLTAAEMQAKSILVQVIDPVSGRAVEDQGFHISTVNHASAQIPNLWSDLQEWLGTAPAALTSQLVQTDWTAATRVLTASTNFNDPTAAAIADAIWDEDATGHQTQGTFGQAIGDPVADASTIWGLVNTNLDATVASRLASADITLASGVVEANVLQLGGVVQSLTDLKDFADSGYDPVNNLTFADSVRISGSAGAADNVEANITNLDAAVSGASTHDAAAAADAVWDEAQSGHVGAGSFGEMASEVASILADTGELQTDDVPGLISALNNLSTAQVNTEVDTALADIHLDHLLAVDTGASLPGVSGSVFQDLLEDDAGTWRYSTNALEQGPTGGGDSAATIADAVWDELQSGHVVAGSFGEDADVAVSSRLASADITLSGGVAEANIVQLGGVVQSLTDLKDFADAGYDPVTNLVGADAVRISGAAAAADSVESNIGNLDASIASRSSHSAADAADSVWDEAKSGHVGAGSMGEEIQSHALTSEIPAAAPTAAANADAVWDEARSGHTAGGSFGETMGTVEANIDSLDASVAGVPAAVMDLTDGIETGFTLREYLRATSAVLLGKSSGVGGGSPVYRDINDLKNRVTAVTSAGNRTSVTLDVS